MKFILTKRIFFILLILSLFLILWFPNFGSIDKMAPQWLYLSLVSFFLGLYHLLNKSLTFNKGPIIYIYSFFLILCFLSFFYSNNIIISIFDFSRIFIIFSLLQFFLSFNYKLNFKDLSLIISFFLLSEVIFYNIIFISSFISGQYLNYISPNNFAGFGANKNITAASICIKLPFLFYSAYTNKNLRFISLIVLLLAFFAIVMISSRASFISLFFICIFFFVSLYYVKSSILFKIRTFFFFTIPLFLAFYFNYLLQKSSQLNVLNRIASIEFSAVSSNGRFELWSNAIDYIKIHPFFGCGLGNWKIESLPYWKDLLYDYSVPYHAHNDFLELATEIGVVGSFVYLSLFVYVFFKLFVHRKNNFLIVSVLFCSLLVYCVDAFFNFPLERPVMQLSFLIIIYSSIKFLSNEVKV